MVVRVALDWTANTTHAALLFAESRGFAKEETGVSLEFVEPTSTDAPPTPLDGLIDGKVDVAICPCDHVLKEHMGQDRVICVATLTAVDISAVCVLESSDITGFVSTRSHGTPCILILRLQPADKTQ
jgi:ABC-type nitrate/sulfonate/bicarbonate transport system substrate-binding protein